MANLAASKIHNGRKRAGSDSFVIANSETLYYGSLVGTNAAGFLTKWADTTAHVFEGYVYEAEVPTVGAAAPGAVSVVGNTSATPPVEAMVDTSGYVLENVAVGSLVQASLNAKVYCDSDNPADFSLSATSNVGAVGTVLRFRSAGFGDVRLYTREEFLGQ